MHGQNHIKIVPYLLQPTCSASTISQSVQRLATAGRSGDGIPVGDEILRTRPDRPWSPPSLLYNVYWVSFPGVKRPGRGVDHPLPFSAGVKERVQLYLYSHSGSSWPRIGWPLPLPVTKGEFRPRQTRQLPRAVDLKERLLSCQSY